MRLVVRALALCAAGWLARTTSHTLAQTPSCAEPPALPSVVKTAILVVCNASPRVLDANPVFDVACNHTATPASTVNFLLGVDMYVNAMREQKMPLRDRTNVTMEYTYINIGTIDWGSPNWEKLALEIAGPSTASGITTDGLMWDILMTPAFGGPFRFVTLPMFTHPSVAVVVANICEDTDKCMVLHPFSSSPNLFICQATTLEPMPEDCIRRDRVSGTRRFKNMLSVLFDPTTVAVSALDTYHTLGTKTVYIIAEGPFLSSFPGAALERTVEFAKQLGMKIVGSTVLDLCKTDGSNCPKDDKGHLLSPPQTQILPHAETTIEFGARMKSLNPDAFIIICTGAGRSHYTLAKLFDGFKGANWTPKMINWAGGGDVNLRPFMSDYNDLLYTWTTAPWDYRLTGPQYKNSLSSSNFELFPANSELDGPAVFAQEYNKRYGALFPGGKFEFNNPSAVGTVLGFQALTFGQKLIESALSADLSNLRMASLTVSTPSIYHQLEFDSYGRTRRVNEMLLMFHPHPRPSPTTAHQVTLVAPYNIGETPVYPLPTWSERTFNPVQYDLPLEKMMAAITAICLAVCLVIVGFVVRHARHSVIRAATPSFCLLTVLGAVLMLSSNFFHTTVASDSHCGAQVWLLSFGFTLLFSSLFVKTFRIWRIFFGRNLAVVKMNDSELLMAICGFLLIDIIINVAWVSSVGMNSKLVIVDPIRPSYNYLTCDYDDSMGFVYAHLAIKCGLLLFGICLTWLVRNTPSQFNESVFIAVSLYNVSFIVAFVVPILSADLGGRNTTYLIRAFAIMFVCTATIVILYAPKLASIYNRSRQGKTLRLVDPRPPSVIAEGPTPAIQDYHSKAIALGRRKADVADASAIGVDVLPKPSHVRNQSCPTIGKITISPRYHAAMISSELLVGVTPKAHTARQLELVHEEVATPNQSVADSKSSHNELHPPANSAVVPHPQPHHFAIDVRVESRGEMPTQSEATTNKHPHESITPDVPGVVDSDELTRFEPTSTMTSPAHFS